MKYWVRVFSMWCEELEERGFIKTDSTHTATCFICRKAALISLRKFLTITDIFIQFFQFYLCDINTLFGASIIPDTHERITGGWAGLSSPTCRPKKSVQTLSAPTSQHLVHVWRKMACERLIDLFKPSHERLLAKFITLVAFIGIKLSMCDCEGISPERCLVWGPGLKPAMVLPVRYFIIQAVNSNGEHLTLSPGKRINTGMSSECHGVTNSFHAKVSYT